MHSYLNKIRYIIIEEGVLNLIRRIFRFFIYKIRRIHATDKLNKANWSIIKNKYKNKRVFLIGNGPSLNNTPLHLLDGEHTFCMNRFNLMFDRITWKPDMYGLSDDVVIMDMINEINTIKSEVKYFFLPEIHPSSPININYKKIIGEHKNIYWFYPDKIGFSDDLPSLGMNKTMTNVAIQILVYFGFSEIYLIGVDMDYSSHPTAKDLDNRHLQSKYDDDPNHFDPRYFGSGRKYHIPRMEETIEKFIGAREFCCKNNVKVMNATVGGKLEVFPRIDFQSLFDINEEEEMRMFLSNLGFDNDIKSLDEAYPNIKVLDNINSWDQNHSTFVIDKDRGLKLIPKAIYSHTPYGPINNKYLFVKK